MEDFNILYIIGATGSGKSSLAISLAKKYNGVIINADSMQIYRGVKILTSVPEDYEREGIEHLLYNFLPIHDSFDVIKWREYALEAIDNVLSMNKMPILCGGTVFYTTSMIDGLSSIPVVSINCREEVRRLQKELSRADFYGLLQQEDIVMANKLKLSDSQRISRALEVIRSTGVSLSYYQKLPRIKIPNYMKIKLMHLKPSIDKVYNNINNRFDKMINKGALNEVKHLISHGISTSNQISKAIGVREFIDYLDGNICLLTAIERGKANTRRYAKRQLTYIRTQLSPDIIIDNNINNHDI